MADENVVLVSFDEESKAYQAATVLKEPSAEGRIDLHAVAVVQRMEDGTLRVKEGDADDFPVGTWTGGAIGAGTGGIIGLTRGHARRRFLDEIEREVRRANDDDQDAHPDVQQ